MPEDQDLGCQRRSRPEQPDQHRPDKAAGFLHRTERLRDSASVVSPIEFTTGTILSRVKSRPIMREGYSFRGQIDPDRHPTRGIGKIPAF